MAVRQTIPMGTKRIISDIAYVGMGEMTHHHIDKPPWPNILKFIPKKEHANEAGTKKKASKVSRETSLAWSKAGFDSAIIALFSATSMVRPQASHSVCAFSRRYWKSVNNASAAISASSRCLSSSNPFVQLDPPRLLIEVKFSFSRRMCESKMHFAFSKLESVQAC